MKKRVTFEDLSKDIKEAIEAYRVAESGSDAPIDREQAMDAWFRERFESWIADRMGTAEGENKRRHHRFDIELPLSISDTIIESSGEEPHVSDLLGTIVNISRGGFYFFAPRAVPVSSILRVTIDFSGFDPGLGSIEALAVLVAALEDRHPVVRAMAAWAIGEVARKNRGLRQAFDLLTARLVDETDTHVLEEIQQSLK